MRPCVAVEWYQRAYEVRYRLLQTRPMNENSVWLQLQHCKLPDHVRCIHMSLSGSGGSRRKIWIMQFIVLQIWVTFQLSGSNENSRSDQTNYFFNNQ